MAACLDSIVGGLEPGDGNTSLPPGVMAKREASTGTIVALTQEGLPVLALRTGADTRTVPARTTVQVSEASIGREAVVLWEHGDASRPIVVGVLTDQPGGLADRARRSQPVTVEADGERVVVSASQDLVLRCGAASITMTAAGKIILQGQYILSRSAGYNKIKGAIVDIN